MAALAFRWFVSTGAVTTAVHTALAELESVPAASETPQIAGCRTALWQLTLAIEAAEAFLHRLAAGSGRLA